MKLPTLSALSRAFFGTRKTASPFRVVKEPAIPNFGNVREDFYQRRLEEGGSARSEGEPEASAPASQAQPGASAFGPRAAARASTPDLFRMRTNPPAAKDGADADASTLVETAAGAEAEEESEVRPAAGKRSFNPFSRKARKGGAARSVRGELAMDAIEVKRNDLSDDDLEVVAAASRRRGAAKKADALTASASDRTAAVNPFAYQEG